MKSERCSLANYIKHICWSSDLNISKCTELGDFVTREAQDTILCVAYQHEIAHIQRHRQWRKSESQGRRAQTWIAKVLWKRETTWTLLPQVCNSLQVKLARVAFMEDVRAEIYGKLRPGVPVGAVPWQPLLWETRSSSKCRLMARKHVSNTCQRSITICKLTQSFPKNYGNQIISASVSSRKLSPALRWGSFLEEVWAILCPS